MSELFKSGETAPRLGIYKAMQGRNHAQEHGVTCVIGHHREKS